MQVLDLIEDNSSKWLVVQTGRGEVTFTLNDNGSLYVLNQDGGALQDTESEFYRTASDAEIYTLSLISMAYSEC